MYFFWKSDILNLKPYNCIDRTFMLNFKYTSHTNYWLKFTSELVL